MRQNKEVSTRIIFFLAFVANMNIAITTNIHKKAFPKILKKGILAWKSKKHLSVIIVDKRIPVPMVLLIYNLLLPNNITKRQVIVSTN